ncbi:unnamed protein product [Phytophthora lilii]|uniref:Unnamed protein product n=1 Tax=Phytophthora lilii TaxID=2077276 RepID=A0A9W6X853_9STRA|nr:unnamed protein product [Phytophthora lilii]
MSGAIGFGEYEALLPCDGVNAALTFSRELLSREYVVQRVVQEALATAVQQNKGKKWRGVARLHVGHVVVSVDGVPVRGLSSRQFAELWYPVPAPENADKATEALKRYRRVRFRDRKRAELEVEMQKDWTRAGPIQFLSIQGDAEMQAKLREVHALIWEHRLTQAHAVLRTLPAGGDPKVCLLAAELEAVRVLVSKDTLYVKQAQRAAKQAVAWIESMYELPSQSYSTRKHMKLALAEALFLSALLRLGDDQRLAAVAAARRSAVFYVELHEKFIASANSAANRDRLLMPEHALQSFQKRIQFGIGVLHIGGGLSLKNTPDWIGTLLKGTSDIKKGIEYLLNSGNGDGDDECYLQANWAALTLMHCSSAIRLVRQRAAKNDQDTSAQLAEAISACQHAALERHPDALLLRWSQATVTHFDSDRLKRLETELMQISVEERAHLVRFDVGYQRFLAREFDRASSQFMTLCKCAHAPPKLRGLSSLFVAIDYLLNSHKSCDLVAQDSKLLSSVRLLLRSARRFLAKRLEINAEDFESASLHERIGIYLDCDDEYLLLLPWEILYVYCHSSKTIMLTSTANTDLYQHHLSALEELKRISTSTRALNDVTSRTNHDVELSLFRAIVLFNLNEIDACDKELQRLWSELRPQGGRPRTSSALGRLLSQPSFRPTAAFVAPVAWFYQLRVLVERRYSRSTLEKVTIDTMPSRKADSPQESGSTFAQQQSPYPYDYFYSGKLQALNKLVTQLANDKVETNNSSPGECSTQS